MIGIQGQSLDPLLPGFVLQPVVPGPTAELEMRSGVLSDGRGPLEIRLVMLHPDLRRHRFEGTLFGRRGERCRGEHGDSAQNPSIFHRRPPVGHDANILPATLPARRISPQVSTCGRGASQETSKRVAEAQEEHRVLVLPRLRIELPADFEAHGADRGGVAQTEASARFEVG